MPRLVEAVQSAGQTVTWVCDPMHGNTESVAGYKTRRYERIRQEVCPSLPSLVAQKDPRLLEKCDAQQKSPDMPGHAGDHVCVTAHACPFDRVRHCRWRPSSMCMSSWALCLAACTWR